MIDPEQERIEYDPPRTLRRQSSWLANEVARAASRLVTAALESEGMRRQHFAVLASLAEQGDASQAELGRRLAIDRSDLHALLGELEGHGLVARIRDPGDRRRNVVSLTAAGRAALERLTARIESAQQEFLAPLTRTERRELRSLLERLVEHHHSSTGLAAG